MTTNINNYDNGLYLEPFFKCHPIEKLDIENVIDNNEFDLLIKEYFENNFDNKIKNTTKIITRKEGKQLTAF
jgi:hypothetical protein